MLDLGPATGNLSAIITAVRDDQLSAPTPCTEATVADLIDHVDGFCVAFGAAGTKTLLPAEQQAPRADGSRLGTEWRERLPQRLAELAQAWGTDAAWTGMTQVGGLDLPGEVAGIIALNEVVVHGWDIAMATGQDYGADSGAVEAAMGFVQGSVAQNPNGTPGLFGPPVDVAADAPPAHQLVALTGRDPAWRP